MYTHLYSCIILLYITKYYTPQSIGWRLRHHHVIWCVDGWPCFELDCTGSINILARTITVVFSKPLTSAIAGSDNTNPCELPESLPAPLVNKNLASCTKRTGLAKYYQIFYCFFPIDQWTPSNFYRIPFLLNFPRRFQTT